MRINYRQHTIVSLFEARSLKIGDETLFNMSFHLFYRISFIIALEILLDIIGHFQVVSDSLIRIFPAFKKSKWIRVSKG